MASSHRLGSRGRLQRAAPLAGFLALVAALSLASSAAAVSHRGTLQSLISAVQRAGRSRKLLQYGYCEATSWNAFLVSDANPGAVAQAPLDPSISPYWISCRSWNNVRMVFRDEFYNEETGETREATYTYLGVLTEAGTDSCALWSSSGSPAGTLQNYTAFTNFLSTTMDKPYDSGAPPVSPYDVCLETYLTNTGTRTDACNSTSTRPWRLEGSYSVSGVSGATSCCDYNTCAGNTGLQSYITGATRQNNGSSPDPSPGPTPSPSPRPSPRPTNGSSPGPSTGGSPGPSPSNNSTSDGSSDSKSNTGTIVGIAVGVSAGVLALAGVGLYCFCKRRRQAESHQDWAAATAAAGAPYGKPAGVAGLDGVPGKLSVPGAPMSHDGVAVVQMGAYGAGAGLPPPAWGPGSYPSSSTNSAAALDAKRPYSGMSGALYGTSGGTLQALPETTPFAAGQDVTATMTGFTAGALTTTQGSTATTSSGQASAAGSVISGRSTAVLADHMRIRYDELKDFVQIGQGGFSNVFKARWQGHQVVLKMVRAELATDKQRAALVREALLMRELQHPAVARVYGVVDEAPHHALVMQLYKRGTLEEFMTLPATSALYDSLSALERLRMAGQVADGMAYLHQRSPPIIHGDLKAANLLVDEDAIAITDFGLAVQLMTSPGGHGGGSASNLEPARSGGSSLSNLYSTLWTSPSLALSVFISPPEVLTNPNAPRQTSTDVYAFGITLLQIMTGKMPYRGMTADMVISLVKSGKRPAVPESLPFGVRQLIEECWAQNPAARPTFKEVAERLKDEMTALANATLATTQSSSRFT